MNTLLLQKMIAYDKGDAQRIHHFLKVYEFASLLAQMEQLPKQTQHILETAAILHDIGIHLSEKKYNSSAGKYQEIEGPAPAREMLTSLHYDETVIDRVCYLIAHHHTYINVDGIDYQLLIEADFLVNAYEDALSAKSISAARERIFKTKSGISILETVYGKIE
jgi:uncharacterized protein